ncbi:MAG: class I SAM-dependent methyltransferase [Anaerolineae bacterium]|nr:class I SAM-dependent methyltransferase [Chloroflexota bacterium]MBP6298244.1 class I SAM-dependent methyltransferase [Anaerolineae bacterium]
MKLWRRITRFGFRLLYNEFAWTYDVVSWIVSAGEWREWQRSAIRALNLPSESKVLEVAHGTGNLQVDLVREEYSCAGVDLSPAMGRIAARKLQGMGYAPNLMCASATALPYGGQTFEGLICTFPTEFLIHPHALSEFRRVLKADGRFAVVLHGILLRGWWRPFLDVLFQATGQGGISQDHVPTAETLGFRYIRVVAAFTASGLTCDVIPMLTPRGYAVVAVGGPMP